MDILCTKYPDADTADALKTVRAHITEYKEHIEALKNGDPFTPILTAPGGAAKAGKMPKKSSKGKKRKRSSGGGMGSLKRRRTDDSDIEIELALDSEADADSLDDFIVNDSEPEADSDSDDKSDEDDFEADRESNAGSDAQKEDEVMEPQEEATVESITAKLVEARKAMEAGVAQKKAASEERKNAINALTSLKKAKSRAQRQKNCFCSLKRSEVCIDISAAIETVPTSFPVLD